MRAIVLGARMVQGFSSGGEIATSIPFLVESAPHRRWGLYSGWHTATVATGLATGIAVAGWLSAALPANALHSWGWRIPFWLSALVVVAGLLIRRTLEETPAFRETAEQGTAKVPLGVLLRDQDRALEAVV